MQVSPAAAQALVSVEDAVNQGYYRHPILPRYNSEPGLKHYTLR